MWTYVGGSGIFVKIALFSFGFHTRKVSCSCSIQLVSDNTHLNRRKAGKRMKTVPKKYLSLIMICILCISMWCPAGTVEVSAAEESQDYTIVLVSGDKEYDTLPVLSEGATLQLDPRLKDVTGEYVDGAEFMYQSSNEEVVTVSDSGLVTAKALPNEMTANISITWENSQDTTKLITATYSVTVNAVAPSEIVLDVAEKTLIVNDGCAISAKVEPQSAAQEVEYHSNNEQVVVVDTNGNVTAKGVGTAIITIAAKSDATVCNTMIFNVIDVPISLELNQTACSLKAAEHLTLTAKVVYASGKKEDVSADKLTFVSGDATVAIVDGYGVITALEQKSYPVNAMVQARYEFSYEMDGVKQTKEISAICEVTVTAVPVEGMEWKNAKRKVTLKIGETYTLLPNILPENATNKNVTYKSSKKSVATVNSKGVITAKSIGETTITVISKENSSVKLTFAVKVYQTVFNVAKLGANGKDSKADTSVINKVLKYATLIDEPIIVVIPDGTYYIDKVLTIYSDTSLCLTDKAVIKRKASAGGSTMLCSKIDKKSGGYTQCKNITITGGTWDGNADGKHDANCFYIGHAKNVTITDTTIKNNSGAHLIELAGVKNALIENVELYGYKKCKEKGYSASQADKEAIQLDYCSSTSTPAMKPHDGTACQNVTIRNCNIHDYMSGIGTHTSMSKVYSKNIRIENNRFTNITNACINLRNFKNVTISGNKASGFTTFLYASSSTGTVKKNTIKNKSFKKKTTSGLRAANGLTVSNRSTFTIAKNQIAKATSNGICVWNGSTAKITDNTIKSNKLYGVRTQGSKITLKSNCLSKNKKGLYDTYQDATIQASDDIRAYYIDIEKQYEYTGKKIKPKIKIKNLNKKYYKVIYKNNKKVGTATVIVTGKGKVKGTVKKTFKVVNE